MFEVVLFVVLIGLLAALVKCSYELGVDDGWEQAGAWNDDHLLPALDRDEIAARTRPATPALDRDELYKVTRPASRDQDA